MKTREKTREILLRLLRDDPSIATDELAAAMGITRKGVEWQIRRLKQDGKLKRIGPDKGGSCEVLK
jgi:ATP-dependent DNA helicase RecG